MSRELLDHVLGCSAVQLRLVSNFRGYLTLVAAHLATGHYNIAYQMEEIKRYLFDDAHYVSVFYKKFLEVCDRNGHNSQPVKGIAAELQALRQDDFENCLLSRCILRLYGVAGGNGSAGDAILVELLQRRPSADGIAYCLEQKNEENRLLQKQVLQLTAERQGQLGQKLAALEREHEVLYQNYQNSLNLVQSLTEQLENAKTYQYPYNRGAVNRLGAVLANPKLLGGSQQIKACLEKLAACEHILNNSNGARTTETAVSVEECTLDQLTEAVDKLWAMCAQYRTAERTERAQLFKTINENNEEITHLRAQISSLQKNAQNAATLPQQTSAREIIELKATIGQLTAERYKQATNIADILIHQQQLNDIISYIESAI